MLAGCTESCLTHVIYMVSVFAWMTAENNVACEKVSNKLDVWARLRLHWIHVAYYQFR
jgi:hypothetical protein